MHKCNEHILNALDLARQLTILADEGEASARDDSCAVLYGIIRDCAYRIRMQAEREVELHQTNGTWQ